jgi:hypothetical protein
VRPCVRVRCRVACSLPTSEGDDAPCGPLSRSSERGMAERLVARSEPGLRVTVDLAGTGLSYAFKLFVTRQPE